MFFDQTSGLDLSGGEIKIRRRSSSDQLDGIMLLI